MSQIVYRIENDGGGLWYDQNGVYCKTIDIICPDAVARDYPMPYDDRHYLDGKMWQSAADSAEQMQHWFSPEDARLLHLAGMKPFSYEVEVVQVLENEVLFCPADVLVKRELRLEDLWDISR